jgi:hypothetical protein
LLILVNVYFPATFVVKQISLSSEKYCRRKYSGLRAVFWTVLLVLLTGGASRFALAQHSGRPTPDLLPEARPDAAIAEVGNPLRIDVLANDIGVPSDGPAPELRTEGVPACATVQIDGRVLVFRGSAACIGTDVVFGYGVKLQGTWMTAAVSVTVKPAGAAPGPGPRGGNVAGGCNVPGLDWQMTRIEGGAFDKSSAPAGIVDFVELIDETSFSVAPLCITLDTIPAEPVDRFFNNLREEDRRDQYPELAAPNSNPIAPGTPGRLPANASQRMAVAFAKWFGERNERQLVLPTLQEYVAVAWELQASRRGAPETDAYLITMRSGNLMWTSTPCGSPGSYWTIGPSNEASAQGKLRKLCYQQSRLDRTGFRLVIKQ